MAEGRALRLIAEDTADLEVLSSAVQVLLMLSIAPVPAVGVAFSEAMSGWSSDISRFLRTCASSARLERLG